jgi:hypothetical protein
LQTEAGEKGVENAIFGERKFGGDGPGKAWSVGVPIPNRTSQAAFLEIGLSVGRSLDQNALETFSFSSSLPFSFHASRNARHLQAPISNYLTASGAAKSRPPSHTLGEEQTRIWQVMGRPSHHSCNLVLAGGRWIDSTGQSCRLFGEALGTVGTDAPTIPLAN